MIKYFSRNDRIQAKQDAVKQAEMAGAVVDSLDVRVALIEKMHRGEMTLDEVQAELKRLKRGAKAAGKVTRSQVYSAG